MNLNVHLAPLINGSSKTMDQSEDPGGGTSVVSRDVTRTDTIVPSRYKHFKILSVLVFLQ